MSGAGLQKSRPAPIAQLGSCTKKSPSAGPRLRKVSIKGSMHDRRGGRPYPKPTPPPIGRTPLTERELIRRPSVQVVRDRDELRVELGAKRADASDDHDGNQGSDQAVLNRGGAAFVLKKSSQHSRSSSRMNLEGSSGRKMKEAAKASLNLTPFSALRFPRLLTSERDRHSARKKSPGARPGRGSLGSRPGCTGGNEQTGHRVNPSKARLLPTAPHRGFMRLAWV